MCAMGDLTMIIGLALKTLTSDLATRQVRCFAFR